jgi:hypothetical protein
MRGGAARGRERHRRPRLTAEDPEEPWFGLVVDHRDVVQPVPDAEGASNGMSRRSPSIFVDVGGRRSATVRSGASDEHQR